MSDYGEEIHPFEQEMVRGVSVVRNFGDPFHLVMEIIIGANNRVGYTPET
jgi:hypothetical protein